MKRPIRIAQIGIGHDHAADTVVCMKGLPETFEIVGYCPVEDEVTRSLRDCYRDLPRLTLEQLFAIPDLDAIAVETDDWNLTKYAQMALEHGFPTHMDKPGAASQEDFETLARTARQKGLTLQLGYMYRYNPMIAQVIQNAKSGQYGDIYSVEAHMDCEHTARKREWLSHFKGGMLYFLGCHLIDLIVQIQGIPESVIPLSFASGFDGTKGEDVGMAVLKYPCGVSFAKTSACEPCGFLRRQLVVCGRDRTVELRPLEAYLPDKSGYLTTTMRDCPAKQGWTAQGDFSEMTPIRRLDPMMLDFAACVRGEKINPYSPEYECQLHRVILAACGVDIDYHSPVVL